MPPPEVSVLLPARNAEATVERAVRSILRQTLRALELVVVDDGSTDATSGLLERLAREDGRIVTLRGEGRGIAHALQLGLARCRAPLIARMDADDEALPERLERSVAALGADGALAGVGTQVEIFRNDRPVSPNMQLYARWLNGLTSPERLARERFIESPLCHPSVTLRRAALDAVGGWEAGDFPEDYQLWLKLLARGYRLTCLPELLFRWRDHDERLTRRDPRYAKERHLALKARFLAEVLPGRRCVVWGAGRIGRALSRELRQNGVEIVSLLDVDPRKIGRRVDGIPVEDWRSLGAPGVLHLVSAVGAKGARENIRLALISAGWSEGEHFTCAA